jgi:hypothetical protein
LLSPWQPFEAEKANKECRKMKEKKVENEAGEMGEDAWIGSLELLKRVWVLSLSVVIRTRFKSGAGIQGIDENLEDQAEFLFQSCC